MFKAAETVNNERVLPGFRWQREQADSLAEIRPATGERAAFITAALSTSPRAPKHRHVRSAWMNRCKHLSCLSGPQRHSLVVIYLSLSLSFSSVFSPPVLESICAHHYLALCSECWQNVLSLTHTSQRQWRKVHWNQFYKINKWIVEVFGLWGDHHFKTGYLKKMKNMISKAIEVRVGDGLRHMSCAHFAGRLIN